MPTPSKISVDFTGVEDRRGGSDHVPPGDYLLEVAGCELKSKKDDETRKYLSWRLRVVKPGDYAGKQLYHTTSLVQESLWSLRAFLVDLLGEDKVPKKALDIPIAAIVKRKPQIGATLDDDEYQGKVKSKIVATFPKGEYDQEQSVGAADETASTDDDEDLEEIDMDDI